jgi:uncharacterized tellurite resistance protein B-like protein
MIEWDRGQVRIDVSAKQLSMPAVCACCGGPSDTIVQNTATRVEGKRVIRTKTSSWNIPYCSTCAAHDRVWPGASAFEVFVLTILTCGIYLYFYIQRRKQALAMCMAGCARPRQAFAYLGWHGTVHQFEVASPVFAQAFLAANAKKVVGADQAARQLLVAAPPTPPRGVVLPPPRNSKPPPPTYVAPPSPRAPPSTARSGFFGASDTVSVAGRTLRGPLAYVVATGSDADASAIVSSLRVGNAAIAEDLPYWPTYSQATPSQRARYLDWLAAGRSDPRVAIGYVFIFFYGLERRVLVDRTDHEIVRAELNRLLAIYGGVKQSFRGYASALAGFMALPQLATLSERDVCSQLGDLFEHDPIARSGLLAWFHVHERPLPARYAMLVAASMDGAKRGAVVKRARAEVEELFAIRYRERFAEGMRLDAAKRPELVSYHPGSPSLLHASRKLAVSIPHVLGRSAQFTPVVDVWNDCIGDLKKLSFTRRTDASAPLTGEAWMALPPELRADHEHPEQDAWDTAVQAAPRLGAFRIIPAGRLAALAGIEVDDRVTGSRLRRAVEAAALLGYAVEPDARVYARTMQASSELVIWEAPITIAPNAALWRSVHTMLSLTLSIALADGEVSDEEAHTVHAMIANLFPLDDAMRSRVAALRLLLVRQPSRVTGVAKKLKESRTPTELAKIGRLLVTVAAVDGVITDGEHRALKNLYKVMGVGASELAAAIVASGARFETDEPVEVRAAQPQRPGEMIPSPASTVPTLNAAAIEAILAETREVAALLSEVLDDDDDRDATPIPSPPRIENPANGEWSTLDFRFHGVLRELLTRPTWTVGDVRALALRSKLMPGAILETLNAWAEDRFGDYVIEEEGDWRINTQLLERRSA